MRDYEEKWRQKVDSAARRYAEAKEAVFRSTETATALQAPHRYGEAQQAIAAELDALDEYTRVLSIFTRLVIDGKEPPTEEER